MHALRKLADSAGVGIQVVSENRLNPPDQNQEIDAVVDIVTDDGSVRLAIESKARAPYPSEARRFDHRRERLSHVGVPTLVCPYISDHSGEVLTSLGWAWLDALGNADVRAPGIRITLRTAKRPPRPNAESLPQGSGSLAIIRFLIGSGRVDGLTKLAHDAGISQPRASQVVQQLVDLDLVQREARSVWTADRERLLDAFLAEYRGPGGSARYLYSLDPPREIARRLAIAAHSQADERLAISGDVAADELVPWRAPSVLVIYASATVEPSAIEVVTAEGKDDANVLWITPRDRSVFAIGKPPALPGLPLADPTQILWDLRRLGGSDRVEAAERLRRWLLSR